MRAIVYAWPSYDVFNVDRSSIHKIDVYVEFFISVYWVDVSENLHFNCLKKQKFHILTLKAGTVPTLQKVRDRTPVSPP